jgi:hypothetical protein
VTTASQPKMMRKDRAMRAFMGVGLEDEEPLLT